MLVCESSANLFDDVSSKTRSLSGRYVGELVQSIPDTTQKHELIWKRRGHQSGITLFSVMMTIHVCATLHEKLHSEMAVKTK